MGRKILALICLVVSVFGFAACSGDLDNTKPTTLTPEQIALQNRTEEEILASASDKPYEELITLNVDHLKIENLITSSKYLLGSPGPHLGGIGPATMGDIRLITISDFNKLYPIECLRKTSDDRCYAIYLNKFGDPIYLCFVLANYRDENNIVHSKYYLHKHLNCPVFSEDKVLIPQVTTIDTFINNATSLTNFPDSGYTLCIVRGQGRVLSLDFEYPRHVDESTVKVLTSMTDQTFEYEILKQDYPQ